MDPPCAGPTGDTRPPPQADETLLSDDDHSRVGRLAAVVEAARRPEPARAMCRAAITALAVSGTSLMVMHDGVLSPLGWSNDVAQRLGALQQALGEGPSLDAYRTGHAVSEPLLAAPRLVRWVAFTPAALVEGAAALFAFPLRLGGVRLGALTLHQTRPGELSPRQYGDAQAVAELAVTAILGTQAGLPKGGLSPDMEELVTYSAPVHQASGMVSVQLGISVGEAGVRLRAHAFAADRPLAEVAADIVARRLRLDE